MTDVISEINDAIAQIEAITKNTRTTELKTIAEALRNIAKKEHRRLRLEGYVLMPNALLNILEKSSTRNYSRSYGYKKHLRIKFESVKEDLKLYIQFLSKEGY
jgi:ribosomal protein L17